MEYTLKREQLVPANIERVFAFFADAGNLDAITPPWLAFRVITPLPLEMRSGALLDYRIRWKGVPIRWRTRIEEWTPMQRFIDTQIRGPYALWHHTHTFEPRSGGTLMTDIVRYGLRFGPLGTLAHRWIVRRDVEAIFDYRFQRIAALFAPRN